MSEDLEPRRPKKVYDSSSTTSRLTPYVIGFVVVVAVAIAGLLLWIYLTTVAIFNPHLEEYLSNTTGPADRPTITKFICVDVASRGLDSLQSELPTEIRAWSPEEVTTVVQIQWHKVVVGKYDNGDSAIRMDCSILVMDLPTKNVIAQQSFQGDPPRQMVKRNDSRSGEKPYKQMVQYLKTLQMKR